MITVSNGLSFIRGPLALLFWQGSPMARFVFIFLAMFTDCVDGYLARRNKSVSQFGAFLDPAMDKFFVFSALCAFLVEGKITGFEMAAMLSRDFFIFLYTILILIMGRWKTVVFRALRWGKVTTALQFIVLMSLCFGSTVHWIISYSFISMGFLAFLELFQTKESRTV